MICVELAFSADARRLEARPAHRDRLLELHRQGRVFSAGPWADDSGALLIFALDDAQLREEFAADPYYTSPGVTIVAVHAWTPIIGVPTRSAATDQS